MIVTDMLPVLDLEAYRAGEPGAGDELAAELRAALEEVGFFSIVGHGVDWALVEDIYRQAARYHGLPDEVKRAQPMTPRRMGYNPLGGESIEGRAPSLNAALFLARPGSARNQWPDEAVLPGFRAACSAYYEAMDRFCHDWLLPLFAVALELEPGYFQPLFDPSLATLRLSHYPAVPAEDVADDQWGIDPHSDAGFMTLLPANPVDGLWIRPAGGDWWEVRQHPRVLRREFRRHAAALVERPSPLHAAPGPQPLGTGPLRHPLLLRPPGRHGHRVPAHLHRRRRPAPARADRLPRLPDPRSWATATPPCGRARAIGGRPRRGRVARGAGLLRR